MQLGTRSQNLVWLCAGAMFVGAVACLAPARAGETLVFEQFETAGIDGRYWDRAFPGARTPDGVHRSVLLRFPGAAEAIAAAGRPVAKAEIVFEYEDFEIQPNDYTVRNNVPEEIRQKGPPQWHYVAWGLRRPWSAQEAPPTFNAWLDGAGYWTKYGAKDETTDRFPHQFGPTEVSSVNPEGRMDVTALLTDEVFGATPGERLRFFEEQGVLVKKWETYDVKYADYSAYEWAIPTGGNGVTFASARLEVTFGDGAAPGGLPPARDLAALADALRRDGGGGHPTAVMPDAAAIAELADRFRFTQPAWMPDWQWERVSELRRIGGGSEYADAIESGDLERYNRQILDILRRPPRYWEGWGVQDLLLLWHQYGDALPEYVQDHMKDYWRGWLYPDLPNEAITVDPQGPEKFEWYNETKDWRGLFSFFRKRWTQDVGTMNFNHTAVMGALLGGEIIDSPFAIEDGRSGLEKMLLRFWTFLDGTSQEMLDHYYFSITLSGQKMFADYAPTHFDRLMGEIIRDRAMELLSAAYQPHLRRMVDASGRVRMSNVLGYEQEGTYSILHTLSPAGVLFHADSARNSRQHGMPRYGYDFPPGRVALQTRASPWAPEWAVGMVDGKPLPFQSTATESTRDNFRNPPLWRRSYLGHRYGIASQDIKGGSVDFMAQWNGGDAAATDADQLGTLTVRYNVNTPRMARTDGGGMAYSGATVTFQHENKAIVCTKPRTERESMERYAGGGGLTKLFSTAALWNFRNPADWTLYIDGKEQTEFPATLQAEQRITLRDDEAYVAIIPLPATDLGGGKIVIEPGRPEQTRDGNNAAIAPALLIHSYNLDSGTPLAADDARWERACRETYGGFVVEMGDIESDGGFAAFQARIAAATLDARWEGDERTLHIVYRSGDDTMEMGFCTDYAQADAHYGVEPGQHSKAIPYRRINEKDPYLPAGIERDTTLAVQGRGRLEKNGAVLEMESGRMGYLITEPASGTYVGYNPLPDLTDWSLSVPGGMDIRADGKLSLARVAVQPTANTLRIDYGFKNDQLEDPSRARRLLVFGAPAAPAVFVNGEAATAEIVNVDGRTAFAVALDP